MEDMEEVDDIAALRAQLASDCPREDIDLLAVQAVLKDAERYRWLRSRPNGSEDWWAALDEGFGENMDRAIDVRMQASEAVGAA
jgi:hypothetical protein